MNAPCIGNVDNADNAPGRWCADAMPRPGLPPGYRHSGGIAGHDVPRRIVLRCRARHCAAMGEIAIVMKHPAAAPGPWQVAATMDAGRGVGA